MLARRETSAPTGSLRCARESSLFGMVSEWEAGPEARLSFDDLPGEPRNADLAARDQFGGLQPTAAGAIMSRRG